ACLSFFDAEVGIRDLHVTGVQTCALPISSVAVEEPNGSLVLVVPRFGTITPWSSKATDIAHNCALRMIDRLERGIAYYVTGELSSDDLQQVRALLHDRMTEQAPDSVEAAAQLFHHTEPKPFNRVDILGGGKAALEQ